MKPSEARAIEAREWLAKAAEDLASAHVLIGSGHLPGALFFCQQAAEKSLKAFLTWHQRTFRRTHDLEELGKDCQAIAARWLRCSKRRTRFPITHGSCVTPGRPRHPNRKKRRPCSASQAAFSGKCSRLALETKTSEDHGDNQS